MEKHLFKTFTEFCPASNCEQTVEIEYSEIPIIGSLKENYKAVSVDFPYSNECIERYCHIQKNHLTISF